LNQIKNLLTKQRISRNPNQEIVEEQQENEKNEYFLLTIPQIKGKSQQDYKKLKETLIGVIYEFRIIKTEDLQFVWQDFVT